MMVRPPEEVSALASGAPRGLKAVYDEEKIAKEIEDDAPDLDEALEQMAKEFEKVASRRSGKSAWPQVSGGLT